jgi:ferric-dicitrate binding protein FerR (iron transport regulator)
MNTRHRLSILLLLASALSAAASAPAERAAEAAKPAAPAVASPTAPWRAVAASGLVDSRAADVVEWTSVKRGADLAVESHVRTGRRGRATLTRNASIVLVDPNSEIVLPAGGPDGNAPVVQDSGRVAYRVDGRVNKNFRVVTPYLVAGVKGTVFLVSVSEGRASVTVEEGTVEVTSRLSGERRDVTSGETLLLETREGSEMELVREDAREREGFKRETLRLAEAESRLLDSAVDRMDSDLTTSVLTADDGLLALDATSLLLEDERKLERTGETSMLDETAVDELLDPIDQVVDDLLRKGSTTSGSGTTTSGSSGN